MESGEEIVDKAMELGFGELELGYHTTEQQLKGFKRRLDEMPVGSVHAFAPIPISAPGGHPELYSLASFDAETRAMARWQVMRCVDVAADIGADTVVLHAGRVMCPAFTKWLRSARRRWRGRKMLKLFEGELDRMTEALSQKGVVLAIENLPYFEGFPDEVEMAQVLERYRGANVKAWLDTGHARVRECNGWIVKSEKGKVKSEKGKEEGQGGEKVGGGGESRLVGEDVWGMHLNDVVDVHDDHLAPGFGKVDFAAYRELAQKVKHVVFEPNSEVKEEALKNGIEFIKKVWS